MLGHSWIIFALESTDQISLKSTTQLLWPLLVSHRPCFICRCAVQVCCCSFVVCSGVWWCFHFRTWGFWFSFGVFVWYFITHALITEIVNKKAQLVWRLIENSWTVLICSSYLDEKFSPVKTCVFPLLRKLSGKGILRTVCGQKFWWKVKFSRSHMNPEDFNLWQCRSLTVLLRCRPDV